MTKEKPQGDEFSAIGKQTMARAYSAMDYYFDHLKEDRRVGTVGRNGVRRESKSLRGAEHFRHTGIRQGH